MMKPGCNKKAVKIRVGACDAFHIRRWVWGVRVTHEQGPLLNWPELSHSSVPVQRHAQAAHRLVQTEA